MLDLSITSIYFDSFLFKLFIFYSFRLAVYKLEITHYTSPFIPKVINGIDAIDGMVMVVASFDFDYFFAPILDYFRLIGS